MSNKEVLMDEQSMPDITPISTAPLSLPELIMRLEELVKFTLECENKELKEGISFVEIYKQLTQIRQAITILTKDQKETLSLIENATKNTNKKKSVKLSKENKKLLNNITHLKGVCENAKERIYESIHEQPEIESQVKEEIKQSTGSKKQKIVRRKGKFRRVGGKKGWMPT